MGLWEGLNNPTFKPLEFERFKSESGSVWHTPQYFVDFFQIKTYFCIKIKNANNEIFF